ncbi:PGAP1-like protein-domain-containing protein [Cytidiella melzeri]|nr:PGAP1-like protein-domain-containing protein [Cytidiella melzeri]
MSTRLVHALGLVSLVVAAILYYAGIDTVQTISPQGCRMSWMSPSYVLQTGFDRSWSPLAGRYSLWLYREVGWEGNEPDGVPVVFIPGNAGSSHQVRSIASSAARQFYHQPYDISPEFRGRHLKHLDFYAVEFNEDLSAFHGTTLDLQTSYTSRAVDYILSRYPAGTTVIIMGHSMGGIVATSLLPHPNISAIITMSTPHSLPPARFDRHIERIYARNRRTLISNPTPILSLCGGATDLMIPSESCVLPPLNVNEDGGEPFRRTVFTSSLEAAWTGVDHRGMVWCHQVRWRVARAALEIGGGSSPSERGIILDSWIPDGHIVPSGYSIIPSNNIGPSSILQPDQHLVVKNILEPHTWFLPIIPNKQDPSRKRKFVLYVSKANSELTLPMLPFGTVVHTCHAHRSCVPLVPTTLKIIPNPSQGALFPLPDQGISENEGVVFFEAEVSFEEDAQIAVTLDGSKKIAWLFGGFIPEPVIKDVSSLAPFLSSVLVDLGRSSSLKHSIYLPRLLSHTLVVYRVVPQYASHCTELMFLPLLEHASHPSETHYHPLTLARKKLLHTHGSAPYIDSPYTHGLNLTIYTDGEGSCAISRIGITVDWWATIGRWGGRYGAPVATWAVGVVALTLYEAARAGRASGTVPRVSDTISTLVRTRMVGLLVASCCISILPLPVHVWLGNRGEPLLVPLAPLMLLIATGLVSVSWWLVLLLQLPLYYVSRLFPSGPERIISSKRPNALISLGLVCLLIFVLVPWQVGFLGCWTFLFYTCASHNPPQADPSSTVAIPLIKTSEERSRNRDQGSITPSPPVTAGIRVSHVVSSHNEREHLLLLMTWLLPLVAPILAVWVRTLLTAGYTTPFDGDHNFLHVLPFLVLVDPGWGFSWLWSPTGGQLWYSKLEWRMLLLAGTAFFLGPREAYLVFEVASAVLGLGLLFSAVWR